MSKARCNRCGGSAESNTYEQARKLINHAVGLGRGIKCGDSYNMVQEIKSQVVAKITKPKTTKPNPPKPETTKPHTSKPETKHDTSKASTSEKPKEKTKPKSSV